MRRENGSERKLLERGPMTTLTEHILPERISAVYEGLPGEPALARLCGELFSRQMFTWQDFAAAHLDLNGAWLREFSAGGHTVLVQYNPGRSVSALAVVDAAAVGDRPCFLCAAHLPAAQAAVRYRDDFLILVNPHPIFSPHFTVAHVRHLPQRLADHGGVLLRLAKDLGPDFTVFYNGPRCGASAPDHHHFQVCPSGAMPVEKEWEAAGLTLPVSRAGIACGCWHLPGRSVVVMEGDDPAAIVSLLTRFLQGRGRAGAVGDDAEPMCNLLCTCRGGRWRLFLFPRRKHRPDAYYREGPDALLVTPGAVEMGGLIITVRENDFLKLDADRALAIYREVAVEPEEVAEIAADLRDGSPAL